jgi:hypothetical protein
MTTGLRPGDPGYEEYLRNGYAAGLEGLWVVGRITTDAMIADLKALLEQGPCPKAEQVLRRLAQRTGLGRGSEQ